MKKYLLVAIKV